MIGSWMLGFLLSILTIEEYQKPAWSWYPEYVGELTLSLGIMDIFFLLMLAWYMGCKFAAHARLVLEMMAVWGKEGGILVLVKF